MSSLTPCGHAVNPDCLQQPDEVNVLSGYTAKNCPVSSNPFKQDRACCRNITHTCFTLQEQQIIVMTASQLRGDAGGFSCLEKASPVYPLPDFITEPIRTDQPIAAEKLQALRQFTAELVTLQGGVSQKMMDSFLAAGYSHCALEELMAGIHLATYINQCCQAYDPPKSSAIDLCSDQLAVTTGEE